jgi:DNA polymerase III epsilon subunit-like protein
MNVVVFDTETTNLEKPFCYNIGYTIVNLDNGETLVKRDYVVEQVWHNPMLFVTAYYADKREKYVAAMRSRKATMAKYGYICQAMIRDFIKYEVAGAYAFNSPFDDKVFGYNCEWFKCNNPFDNVPIFDIRGYVCEFMVDDNFKAFCEEHGYFTDGGNYSTTAEVMFRYLTGNTEFIEDHTALSDSEIEAAILIECLRRGAEPNTEYKVPRFIKREVEKVLTLNARNGESYEFPYTSIRMNKEKTKIYLK